MERLTINCRKSGALGIVRTFLGVPCLWASGATVSATAFDTQRETRISVAGAEAGDGDSGVRQTC